MIPTKWIFPAAVTCLLVGCGGTGGPPEGGGPAESPAAATDDAAAAGESSAGTDDSATKPAEEVSVPFTLNPPSPAPADASDATADDEFDAIVLQLTSDDLRVRGRADDLLERVEDAVPRCIELLRDNDPAIRRGAAFFLLGKYDAGHAEVDAALIAALSDEDAGVRHIALQAVNESDDADVLPTIGQLARMLADDQEQTTLRTLIARRLARLGPAAAEVLPTVIRLGQTDADRDVRAACLYAVFRMADRDTAVGVFRQVLSDENDAGLRGVTASRLGGYGAAAADIVEDLAAAFDREPDPAARKKMAEALARIGPAALPALVARFGAADKQRRLLVIDAVGRMGPAAAAARPQLENLRNDDDQEVRQQVEMSLLRIQGLP